MTGRQQLIFCQFIHFIILAALEFTLKMKNEKNLIFQLIEYYYVEGEASAWLLKGMTPSLFLCLTFINGNRFNHLGKRNLFFQKCTLLASIRNIINSNLREKAYHFVPRLDHLF